MSLRYFIFLFSAILFSRMAWWEWPDAVLIVPLLCLVTTGSCVTYAKKSEYKWTHTVRTPVIQGSTAFENSS